MVRLVQISDTHLSPDLRHFTGNWPPVKAWIAAQRPQFVLHCGDVTIDGADQDGDAAYCAGLLHALGVPVRAVPGNHDVGDAGSGHQPVNDERLGRWRRHFGPDRWLQDVEGWRLIGFNTLLLGSGEREEGEQDDWLERAMADADGRRIAWFTHRPLFIDHPGEGDKGYWSVKPEPRARLFALMQRHPVQLVSTGHLHRWRDLQVDGTRYLWAPSTAFLVGPMEAPPLPGAAQLGGVVYDIDGDRLVARYAEIDGLARLWIDDVVDEVYPRRDAHV